MTHAELSSRSGFTILTVRRRMNRGETEEQIIAEGQARSVSLKDPEEDDESFIQAQTRKERALADQNELKAAHMAGTLVSREAVDLWVSTMILRARDVLLRIAPELRDKLAHETDSAIVGDLIDREVRRALSELAEFKQ
jgi:phage terminase Nu1 subunit (DNA packaging protein)